MAMDNNFWRECAAWLTRCKILPPDHKANWEDSQIKVLAVTLRDGVLLCNLIKFLDPSALENREFHKKPQMAQFLCCQNINVFLDTCCRNFNIKDNDLFDPAMLYDLTNFHKVLLTLSKLSISRRVQQNHPNLHGFDVQHFCNEQNRSEELYRDLHSTASSAMNCNMSVDVKEEELYQDLCSVQRSCKLQITENSNFERRDYIIRELIDTEINYIDVLHALRYKFMQPLEKQLSKEKVKEIFPNIPELLDIHTKFLGKLKEAFEPTSSHLISTVFLDFRELFLIYGEYCSKLTCATDTLISVCKQNYSIEILVQECEKEYNIGKSQLRDILSVPMQRILKYHLLLEKLLQETSPISEHYRHLERAKEAMIDVAQYINEVKRDTDHLIIIQKVKESIVDLQLPSGNDLKQYGHLLLDGEMHIKAHEDQKTKHRYAFIFDKLIILVKTLNVKTDDCQYLFKESYNLADYRVEIGHARRTLVRDTRFKCQLILVRKSQKTAFTLYLKSETERNKWCKALNDAMDNLDPPGCRNTDHKFEITTFALPCTCRHCSKFLKGRIHQGYKCKLCTIVVHKGCISSTGRCKPTIQNLPPPVCDRQLSEFNWFVGAMDRDTAAFKLEFRKIGTYMVRVRPQGASNTDETMYAISLKTDDHVIKHMKVNQKHNGDHAIYCLSTQRHFKSIVELISYYERNDLGENFFGLNQSLEWPFKEEIVTAIYDFEPNGSNQLPLQQGCQVIVIGKDGDNKGWWRGKIKNLVGYFPKEYVRENVEANVVDHTSMPIVNTCITVQLHNLLEYIAKVKWADGLKIENIKHNIS